MISSKDLAYRRMGKVVRVFLVEIAMLGSLQLVVVETVLQIEVYNLITCLGKYTTLLQ